MASLMLAATKPAMAASPPPWPALKSDIRRRYPNVPQLSVPELQAWLKDASRARPLLLDVRTAAEFAEGHLAGAVRAGSAREAMKLLRARPADTPVVLYCSVGERSSAMAEVLLSEGAQDVRNLEGSLFEWANAGHPVVGESGPTGKVHPYDKQWGQLLRRELWSREP